MTAKGKARIMASGALVALLGACGHQNPVTSPAPAPAPATAARVVGGEPAAVAQAHADSIRHPYVEADVQFMTGMIYHHSQAIVMARWAPSHGASSSIQTLCGRIINAQNDEITKMQIWLRDRQKPTPTPLANALSGPPWMDFSGMPMMAGMSMTGGEMLMPGMLTADQMKALDAARGPEFDHLFLNYMIQHHSGAVTMVKNLFESEGAAQDEIVFKFASDVNVDQTTEIARMRKMLLQLVLSAGGQ